MSLTLLMAPMYGGKSSELLRILSVEEHGGSKILFINHSLDTRTDQPFSTHSPLHKEKLPFIDMFSVRFLSDISPEIYDRYDVIGIDEGQFFEDLEFVLELVDKKKKIVYISALNGDYQRKSFGKIPMLISHADDIRFLKDAYCMLCKKQGVRTKAIFSHRIRDVSHSQIQVGSDEYLPVCRNCYNSASTS